MIVTVYVALPAWSCLLDTVGCTVCPQRRNLSSGCFWSLCLLSYFSWFWGLNPQPHPIPHTTLTNGLPAQPRVRCLHFFLFLDSYHVGFVHKLHLEYYVYNNCFFSFDSIMNLFGVLKYKRMGEDFLRQSGLPFTILRF